MNIIVVETEEQKQQFLQVHVDINKHDPNWIRPLDQDVDNVFDPQKNSMFRYGEIIRWLLIDDNKPVGRIAAFINEKYFNKDDEFPVGGVSLFDCIDNQEAANILFDTARDWLSAKGMKAMDGPINFGERDKFWGLMVEGFHTPVYGMSYNPLYYKQLFENYGFQVFYNQICFHIDIKAGTKQIRQKNYDDYTRYAKDKEYRVISISKRNLKKFACDFATLYNRAWASHEGGKNITEEKAQKGFVKLRPIVKKYTGWITYHNDKPVAMWVNILDMNEVFRKFNGRFGWLEKLRTFIHIKTRAMTSLVGVIYGIDPDYQGTGVDNYMIVHAENDLKTLTNFKKLELQWIGDFNPKMLSIARHLDSKESRRLTTYRYLFDRNKPFKRHPVVNIKE